MFHYAQLHFDLEGTLYILAAVVSLGIIFGCLFKPLNEDYKKEKSGDSNEIIRKDQKSESERCFGSHLIIFKSPPMVLVMLCHLLMHLGNVTNINWFLAQFFKIIQ